MLVILEGIDHCGKNSIANLLVEKNRFIQFDFPDYSTDFGKFIKDRLYKNDLSPLSLQLLFTSERVNKIEKLNEKLKGEENIVTARYNYSALCYASARGLDGNAIFKLESILPKPDIKIFLKISVNTSMARSSNPDFIEKDKNLLSFVKDKYDQLINKEGDWFVLDGERQIEDIYKDVICILDNYAK